jgi:hypothetical protein
VVIRPEVQPPRAQRDERVSDLFPIFLFGLTLFSGALIGLAIRDLNKRKE